MIQGSVEGEHGALISGMACSFPFETPVEVDSLSVSTDGILGDGGLVRIDIIPILDTPLIDTIAAINGCEGTGK